MSKTKNLWEIYIWDIIYNALDATTISGSFCAPFLSCSLFEGVLDSSRTTKTSCPTGDTWALEDLGLDGTFESIGINLGLRGRVLTDVLVGEVDCLASVTSKDFSPGSVCLMTSTLAVCESCLSTVFRCSFSSSNCLLSDWGMVDTRFAIINKPKITTTTTFYWSLP